MDDRYDARSPISTGFDYGQFQEESDEEEDRRARPRGKTANDSLTTISEVSAAYHCEQYQEKRAEDNIAIAAAVVGGESTYQPPVSPLADIPQIRPAKSRSCPGKYRYGNTPMS